MSEKLKNKWDRILSAFDKPNVSADTANDQYESLALLSVNPDDFEDNKDYDEIIVNKSGFDERKHYEEMYRKFLIDSNLLRVPEDFIKDKISGVKIYQVDETGKPVGVPLSKFNPLTEKTTFRKGAELNPVVVEAEYLNLLSKGFTKFYPKHSGTQAEATAYLTVAYQAGIKAGVSPEDIIFPKAFAHLKEQLKDSSELSVTADADSDIEPVSQEPVSSSKADSGPVDESKPEKKPETKPVAKSPRKPKAV